MSDNSNEGAPRGSGNLLLRLFALGVVSAAIGYGAVYVSLMGADNDRTRPVPAKTAKNEQSKQPAAASKDQQSGLRALATGEMATFVFAPNREPAPELSFVDGDEKPVTLAQRQGRYVLLNLWATWCAPCRKEMPALSRLQKELGGDNFEVLTLSIDADGLSKPRKFLEKKQITNLPLYNKPGLAAGRALKAIGMPTTILIDPKGLIVGRLAGPAEWDSADAKALILGVIKNDTTS